jgi:enolase
MQSEAAIKNIKARKVYNSRGSPTIEIEISTTKATIRVEAPSGASTGEHEVVSYPQGGVEEAIMLVNDVIAPQLLTFNIKKQEIILVKSPHHTRIYLFFNTYQATILSPYLTR